MTSPRSQSLEGASKALKIQPTLSQSRPELASPVEQLRLLDSVPLKAEFEELLGNSTLMPLRATGIEVFQVNVGRICNQTCSHCHVDAGPSRTEVMSRATAERCIDVLGATEIPTLDITGGAPEMCPSFEYLVREARALGRHVIDRCNLTILLAPRYAHLPQFFAEHQVEVVCSLPHYRQFGTDKQRGDGVFEASIEALQRLNAVGYGRDEKLRLVLVTNPVGAFLPAGQQSLEAEWKREMKHRYDVDFDSLFTITNMPISRYLEWLDRTENLTGYLQKLVDAYNPVAAAGVMCRTMI
ncbi:MAG: arsenosugar biosynthesis radical SAM (seleno)protein ArsS, partial [Planctomycetota bacterium]